METSIETPPEHNRDQTPFDKEMSSPCQNSLTHLRRCVTIESWCIVFASIDRVASRTAGLNTGGKEGFDISILLGFFELLHR